MFCTETVEVVEFPDNVYEAAVDIVEPVWSVMSSMFVQVGGDLGGSCQDVLHGWKRTLSSLKGENFCVNLEGLCFAFTDTVEVVEFPENVYEAAVDFTISEKNFFCSYQR